MQELDDNGLLQEYVRRNSEEAFATLVERHVNKVYSVALRLTGNPHQAEEITQAVFVILARKSHQLGRGVILYSWLYKTARLTSAAFIRGEVRRARREQEAYMQKILSETNEPDVWPQVAPLLDAALAMLNETDRRALVLRFFYGKTMKEVGIGLGANEDAAKKRVSRALEKMQHYFAKHGVQSTTAILGEAILANSVLIAPLTLAKTATAVALSKGAPASASTSTLIKGALKIMAWTKVKTAILVSACVLLAVGATTITVKKFTPFSAEDVFTHPDDDHLAKAPPVVILRPARYPTAGSKLNHMHGPPFSVASERFVELSQPLDWVISVAYDIGPERMILLPNFPVGRFDFLSAVLNDPKGALREEIKKQFGLIAHTEVQPRNVFVLKVINPNAPSLKINASGSTDHGIDVADGKLTLVDFAMSGLEKAFEEKGSRTVVVKTNLDDSVVNVLGGYYLGVPVIDETGLTNSYDIDVQWNGKLAGDDRTKAIENAMREQLGLELTPTNMPITVLVVEYEEEHQVEPPLRENAWTSAGYGTPEAAFQSGLEAMSTGDVKKYLASLTPDYQKRFLRSSGARGKAQNQIATRLKHDAAEVVAFQIITEEILSDDTVVLYVRSTRLGNGYVTMKKSGGEWKFDGEIH
ncbi:MAG TPA: TIGR03435 family protein [Verrucomicrobiae bacterium]|jgi:uncharacterized protein (TIGR03435 family)